jgi:hypothetical protein
MQTTIAKMVFATQSILCISAQPVQPSFADTCPQYATELWKVRFNADYTPPQVDKLKPSRKIGDPVFIADGKALTELCNATHMDRILLGIGYPAEYISYLKENAKAGLNMTLVVFKDEELFPATWENVLSTAQKMVEDGFDNKMLKKGCFQPGNTCSWEVPNLAHPQWAMKLMESTSLERKFNFGKPEDRNRTQIFPVDGELMNLEMALDNGFALDYGEKFIAQLRSFLFNELGCNSEFKGDGSTWNFDDGSNAWISPQGTEYLVRNFDLNTTTKRHHKILVDFPWKDSVNV